jgi:hypothetical protein
VFLVKASYSLLIASSGSASAYIFRERSGRLSDSYSVPPGAYLTIANVGLKLMTW